MRAPGPAHQRVTAAPEPRGEADGTGRQLEPTTCPECLAPGEALDHFVLESTDGPVEHLHIRCAAGHRFVLPAEMLARCVEAGAAEHATYLLGGRHRGRGHPGEEHHPAVPDR